jgi:hypothetical protein
MTYAYVKPTTFVICLWNAAVRLGIGPKGGMRGPYIEYKASITMGRYLRAQRMSEVKEGWRGGIRTHERLRVRIDTIRRRVHSTG